MYIYVYIYICIYKYIYTFIGEDVRVSEGKMALVQGIFSDIYV
jgi:hypothetical protein